MKEKLFIDTNAFVYFLTHNKDKTTKVQEILESEEYEIFTNVLVINELVYKLLWISASEKLKTNKIRNDVYLRFIDFYSHLKSRCTVLDMKEDDIMLSCSISNNYGILPTDACIIVTMIKNNIKKILTDDSDFKKVHEIEVIEI